ncbi:MAG TPA: class I SAM-dependent methyltransferase, partial [Microthrixaceae bacterium]|nr:class I SAM-dependent methyltransferase [Microthrixaceae bacterium]
MTTTTETKMDSAKFEEFVGRFVGDLGVLFHAATVLLGDTLGLYEAMADGRPMSAEELADVSGIDNRYALEWLNAQVAAGYVEHDPTTDRYQLPAEHAAVLVSGASPIFAPGAFLLAASAIRDEPAIAEVFRTGEGFGWHQHNHDLFIGTERFFRPGYAANLVDAWLPALDGVVEKLKMGALVADVGCGLGSSTVLMAQAFPKSRFVGSDYHAESIDLARMAADAAGVTDRVDFEVAQADTFSGRDYDLITFFDCLHDMGDPVGAARHVADVLAEDGTWMIVEPMAGETVDANVNPVGKVYYSASTLICTPASKSQPVGLA